MRRLQLALILLYAAMLVVSAWRHEVRPAVLDRPVLAARGLLHQVGIAPGLDVFVDDRNVDTDRKKVASCFEVRELRPGSPPASLYTSGQCTPTGLRWFVPAELIQPGVMAAPVVWLASDSSDGFNGMRFIGAKWDESLPLEQRIETAGAPAAWPQLGRQAIRPA